MDIKIAKHTDEVLVGWAGVSPAGALLYIHVCYLFIWYGTIVIWPPWAPALQANIKLLGYFLKVWKSSNPLIDTCYREHSSYENAESLIHCHILGQKTLSFSPHGNEGLLQTKFLSTYTYHRVYLCPHILYQNHSHILCSPNPDLQTGIRLTERLQKGPETTLLLDDPWLSSPCTRAHILYAKGNVEQLGTQ